MSPADQQAAEHHHNAQVHLRATKKSISLARERLPLCPRDTEARGILAELLRIERRLEALAVPEPVQLEARLCG